MLTCLRMFVRSSVCAFSLVDRLKKRKADGTAEAGEWEGAGIRASAVLLCSLFLASSPARAPEGFVFFFRA